MAGLLVVVATLVVVSVSSAWAADDSPKALPIGGLSQDGSAYQLGVGRLDTFFGWAEPDVDDTTTRLVGQATGEPARAGTPTAEPEGAEERAN